MPNVCRDHWFSLHIIFFYDCKLAAFTWKCKNKIDTRVTYLKKNYLIQKLHIRSGSEINENGVGGNWST